MGKGKSLCTMTWTFSFSYFLYIVSREEFYILCFVMYNCLITKLSIFTWQLCVMFTINKHNVFLKGMNGNNGKEDTDLDVKQDYKSAYVASLHICFQLTQVKRIVKRLTFFLCDLVMVRNCLKLRLVENFVQFQNCNAKRKQFDKS